MTVDESMTLEELTALVAATVRDVLALAGRDLPPDTELSAESALFGRGALLDSLGLVSLVLELEMAVNERFDADIVLADEKAMSQKNSPFRTIGALAAYIRQAIVDAHAGAPA